MTMRFDTKSGEFVDDSVSKGSGSTSSKNQGNKRTHIIDIPEPNTILSGEGKPDASLGNPGDFYIDVALMQIYGPKAEAWGAAVDLIGKSGDSVKGDKGDSIKGDPGTPGTPGKPGNHGNPGLGMASIIQDGLNLIITLDNGVAKTFAIPAPLQGKDGTGIVGFKKISPEKIEIMLSDGKNYAIDLPPGKDGKEIELRRHLMMVQWRYTGEAWKDLFPIPPITNGSGGAGVYELIRLSDIHITDLQDGETITWDASENKWVNSVGGGDSSGFVTVGVSDGTFRVSSYGGNPKLAIEAALAESNSIIILPGTYTFTDPISISTTEAIEIQGSGNPVFVINHSGAVGAISAVVTENMVIEGIEFQINTWVASQQIIAISPPGGVFENVNCQVRDNIFTFGTGVENDFAPTFSPGNEMIGLMVTQGVSCEIDNNTVYPNKGVTGIKTSNGFGNIIERNKIKNASVFYFTSIPDSLRRPCYIGVDSQGETATIIRNNIFQNLGLVDASPPRVDRRLTHALRVQIPNTDITGNEYGHAVLQNNIFEDCLTDTTCVVDLRGPRWLMMSGGYFCFNGTATALGSGFVRVTDGNGDRTGTLSYAYQCQIVGVHFHNNGTTQSAAIYVNSARDLAIQSCTFHELHSTAAIQVDPGAVANNVKSLTITGCKASWPSASPTTRYLIQRTGSTANAAKDLFVGDTVCSTADSSQPVDGIYTGTIFADKHCINGIVDSNGVAVDYTMSTNNYFLGDGASTPGATGINLQSVLDQGNTSTTSMTLTGGTSAAFAETLDGTATAGSLKWLDLKSGGVSYGSLEMISNFVGFFSGNGIFCASALNNFILINGGNIGYFTTGTHTFTGNATFGGLTTVTGGLVLTTTNANISNVDVALGTGAGTKWATTILQKQAWWNATPVVQPANTTALDTLPETLGFRATGGVANFATTLTPRTGTATAGTAPIKMTAGTSLTVPEAGAIQYDGTAFYMTV